jgi:hypothetical protein
MCRTAINFEVALALIDDAHKVVDGLARIVIVQNDAVRNDAVAGFVNRKANLNISAIIVRIMRQHRELPL